jgi:hypothetical protein
MADGSRKPIEEILVGDKVLATDPLTGETAAKVVTDLINSTGIKDLIEITVMPGSIGGEDGPSLTATAEHPFWVPSLGKWIDAAALQSGQWLRTESGTWAKIVVIKRSSAPRQVYNLTVADIHTYHVGVLDQHVLVHNNGPFCGVPIGGKIGDGLGNVDFHGTDYTLNEYIEFVVGHTGDGNPAMGRPSAREIEKALRYAGPVKKGEQNASDFVHGGVRVIINWAKPWKSTSYYIGR